MNYDLLKYNLSIMKIQIRDLCKKLNISRSAWNRKTTGKSEFTRLEIQKMITELNLNQNQVKEIFFNK